MRFIYCLYCEEYGTAPNVEPVCEHKGDPQWMAACTLLPEEDWKILGRVVHPWRKAAKTYEGHFLYRVQDTTSNEVLSFGESTEVKQKTQHEQQMKAMMDSIAEGVVDAAVEMYVSKGGFLPKGSGKSTKTDAYGHTYTVTASPYVYTWSAEIPMSAPEKAEANKPQYVKLHKPKSGNLSQYHGQKYHAPCKHKFGSKKGK